MVPINGYLFKVVGIMKKTERLAAEDINRAALIPITLAQRLFPTKKIRTIYARGKDTNISTAELSQFFYRRFGEEQRFEIQSQKLILETQQKSIKIFEYVLWTIGGISLLVGGIGIMNIMLVSVTERVREIGIRRAVGATKWDIKIQFLFESILLCVLGGLGGATLGFFTSRLISRSFQFSPVFSGKLLLLAISIATVLGIVCGTYPAVRAANQDPTIVLRYE
jgi:putative ABC transport system permease protein